MMARAKVKATIAGVVATAVVGLLIVVGSRNLQHFDAALVGYTFATLFAAFGIGYRYAMWLQRPPTRMYWRRGWQAFGRPKFLLTNLTILIKRFFVDTLVSFGHRGLSCPPAGPPSCPRSPAAMAMRVPPTRSGRASR